MDSTDFFNINSITDKIPEDKYKVYLNNYSETIENLPDHITHLKLYNKPIDNFNQEIKSLPKNLTHLIIIHNYCQKIPYKLLDNLEEIILIGYDNNNDNNNDNLYKHIGELFNYCYNKNIKLTSIINNNEEVLNEKITNDKFINKDNSINRLNLFLIIGYEIIKYQNKLFFKRGNKLYRFINDINVFALYINNNIIEI
jgi:hypothetical protein